MMIALYFIELRLDLKVFDTVFLCLFRDALFEFKDYRGSFLFVVFLNLDVINHLGSDMDNIWIERGYLVLIFGGNFFI